MPQAEDEPKPVPEVVKPKKKEVPGEPVSPHNHLFEQEFIEGKGHKSGGMGGLFVKR